MHFGEAASPSRDRVIGFPTPSGARDQLSASFLTGAEQFRRGQKNARSHIMTKVARRWVLAAVLAAILLDSAAGQFSSSLFGGDTGDDPFGQAVKSPTAAPSLDSIFASSPPPSPAKGGSGIGSSLFPDLFASPPPAPSAAGPSPATRSPPAAKAKSPPPASLNLLKRANAAGLVPASGPPAPPVATLQNLAPSQSVIITDVPPSLNIFNADEEAMAPTLAGTALGPTVAPATLDFSKPAVEGTHSFSSPGCPGPTVGIPLNGESLQSYSTQICSPAAVASALPPALQKVVPSLAGPVSIDLGGERTAGSGTPVATTAAISVAGGKYTGKIAIPQAADTPWAANVNGYDFQFSEQGLSVTIDGQAVTVPLGSSARRRRLRSQTAFEAIKARLGFGSGHHHHDLVEGHEALRANGRHLQQTKVPASTAKSPPATPPPPPVGDVFALRLVLTKCDPPMPISGAEATAFISGFNRENFPIALEEGGNGSAAYVGLLNMDELFPNLQYYLTTTIDYCQANQANIARSCSVGTSSSQSYANSSLLLNACTSFATSGSLQSITQAPRQVVVACSVLAVQMSLLCSGQDRLNCNAVAQNTFTIKVNAEATGLPGIYQNRSASLGAIYQNIANGKPGVPFLLGLDNVASVDVDDGSCSAVQQPTSLAG
ncbi:hypothetical protein WJX73_008131 [Symbiochloris irregularis]|uniref:Pherophorin domain-containing protein n=1 Tax=Symbiochloris irregularis TaxID=706552 RepID=A0AAW1P7I4_9CHLO